jgi:hypothetical protein
LTRNLAVQRIGGSETVNKVVARFTDGRVVKGTTANFIPSQEKFHVSVEGAELSSRPVEIHTNELKALFFVKDFIGDSKRIELSEFDPSHPAVGRKIKVEFKDGEVLVGTTTGYQPGRPGFFMQPADNDSNNERCYIFAAATADVSFI